MRIISGKYGGRPLKAIEGQNTRPTTDKVKEAMFHMIGPYFDGGVVLDLYAGSGALGIEAVSRGLDHAFLVDQSSEAIKFINENVKMTKEPDNFTVIKSSAENALNSLDIKNTEIGLLILDPPYQKETVVEDVKSLNKMGLFTKRAIILCETSSHIELPETIDQFSLWKEKDYGQSKVTIYRVGEQDE